MSETAIKVFFSYSSKDEGLRDELEDHLATLQKRRVITTWHKRKIGAGADWQKQVDDNLRQADIILLLISASFLASDYCYDDVELQLAKERHEAGKALIIPIILSPVDWADPFLSKLASLPRSGKPVTSWEDKHSAFADIAQGIRRAATQLLAQRKQDETLRKYRESLGLYREKVIELSKNGEISSIDRDILNDLRGELGISFEEAKNIENQELKRQKGRKENQQKYEKTFRKVVENEYPNITQETRIKLIQRKGELGLSDNEVEEIESKIIAEKISSLGSHQMTWRSCLGCLSLLIGFPIIVAAYNYIVHRPDPQLQTRMSFGERVLVPQEQENCKKSGSNFEEDKARGRFKAALDACRNAPETLIYFSNDAIGSRKAYVIAVTVPITGADPKSRGNALMMLRGFAQAQNEVNEKGGIKGIPVKLKIINDSDDPAIDKKSANELVKNDNEVLAVLGHWTSNVSLEAANIYEKKLAFITPISITDELGKIPYIFRMNPTGDEGATVLKDYILKALKRKVALVFYDPAIPYSKELKEKFTYLFEKGGGKILDYVDLNVYLNSQNKINQAAQEKAVLVLFPASRSVGAAKTVIESNRSQLPLIGDMANLYIPETRNVDGAKGMILATSWNATSNPNLQFSINAKALWEAEVSWSGM